MFMDRSTAISSLLDRASPCWAGEARVVREYFGSASRSRETDVRWIGFQVFKEFTGSGVYGGPNVTVAAILRSAADDAGRLDLSTPGDEIREVLDRLHFAVDEFRHTTQLIALYRAVGGDPERAISSLGSLDQGVRLVALRHAHRRTVIGRWAVDLSEGGGLGMYFGIQEHFRLQSRDDALSRGITDMAKVTLRDEMKHLVHRFAVVLDHVDDSATWHQVELALQEIAVQKLHERNEQFSSPLSNEEISRCVKDVDQGRKYVRAHLGFLLSGVQHHASLDSM